MEKTKLQLQTALDVLAPQFKILRGVIGGLKSAHRLASAESADALPMQKVLTKLELAASEIDDPEVEAAVRLFAADTQTALDNLAFDFAKDLRTAFAARDIQVEGRPPLLTVGMLTFKIDIAARKGQWLYGKEPLTRPIPLSLTGIIKAYDQQVKRIINRQLVTSEFLQELYNTWKVCLNKRKQRPTGGRINIVEIYSELTILRQNNRFWNAPSRRTFKDYEREFFVRDLTLLRDAGVVMISAENTQKRLRLGIATKVQALKTNRSIWLPETALDGQYYGDVSFD